jgi:hypothetical protein
MSAAAGLRVRVTVGDTWVPVLLEADAGEAVASLKARSLAAQWIPPERADAYEVKLGGAPVRDEAQTLGALGVPDGAALVVLARRRRVVR